MPRKVPGEGRGEAVAVLSFVSPEVRGSMAQDHILLSSVQTRAGEIAHEEQRERERESDIYRTIYDFIRFDDTK